MPTGRAAALRPIGSNLPQRTEFHDLRRIDEPSLDESSIH